MNLALYASSLLRRDLAFVQSGDRTPVSLYCSTDMSEDDWIQKRGVTMAGEKTYTGAGWLSDGRTYQFTVPLDENWAVIELPGPAPGSRHQEVVPLSELFDKLSTLVGKR